MKRLFQTMTLLVFLILGQGLSFGQNDWSKYEVEAPFAFTINVPNDMEASVQKINTAVGTLDVLSYAYQGDDEDPNYLYLINIVQYPEATFPKDSLDLISEYLENAIISTMDRVGGALLYSSDIEKGSGKLYRIKYNGDNAIIKGKSFIKQDAFVNLQVFTTKDKSLNEEMDYFLDSFRMN